MNNINYQISSLQELHNYQTQMSSSSASSSSHFDLMSSHNDFLEQMLSSVPSSSGVTFPWADDHELPPPTPDVCGNLEEQSSLLMASKQRQNLIGNGAAKALMLQQHLLLSSGLCSPMGGTSNGLLGDHDDVVGGSSKSTNAANDASINSLFNGSFSGSLGQISNQPQNFQHHQGGTLDGQNYGSPAEAAATASGGGAAGQPKQRVRARRGQATDPHSIAERLRRERIAERMKGLQELVPNANKTDKASMLDEIIDYVKFLQLQVKVLSMSRLGGAAAVSPVAADISPKGKSGNGTKTANNNDGVTATEQQVAKLLEEDMGSAMQYLQGKGLCLMPISLATAISTATSHSKNPMAMAMPMPTSNSLGLSKSPLLKGESGPPTSPSISALTVQSVARGGNMTNSGGGEIS